MARRVRQHVNPLGLKFLMPKATAIQRPAHLEPDCEVDVELGCADGKFSFDTARAFPDRFVVGLDIREKVTDANNELAKREGLSNLRFAYVNINVDLDRVFAENSVDRFHLLFPDPWFKNRHQKRRVIEPTVLNTMRRQLRSDGEVHFASDIYELTLEAMYEFESEAGMAAGFANLAGSWTFWRGNPFSASSRREDTTLHRGQRVWRVRYGLGSSSASSSSAHAS